MSYASPAVAPVTAAQGPSQTELPELAKVYWRGRVDARRLRRAGQLWTLSAVAHTVPFLVVAAALIVLQPLAFPVAAIALVHAWVIPALYAQRGANVIRRPWRPSPVRPTSPDSEDLQAERLALGLLGDLVGHSARALLAQTGLAMERGRLGVWLVGEAGAILLTRGGRQVYCYCVRVDAACGSASGRLAHSGGDRPRVAAELPRGDRIAHLLLALRVDEAGFATVANLAFAGARWRLARRLPADVRPALRAAAAAARGR
jgi:hypothetical protein